MSEFLRLISFETPLALLALLVLPILWWLLRSIPPRPKSLSFPPIRILLKLKPREETPDKMPWWLLLLRLCLAGLVIFAVAHPFLRKADTISKTNGPLLLAIDDGWASGNNWSKRLEAATQILNSVHDRVVYVVATSKPDKPLSTTADAALKTLLATQPNALPVDRTKALNAVQGLEPKPTEAIWLTDGLDQASGQIFAEGLKANIGTLQVFGTKEQQDILALSTPQLVGGDIVASVFRGSQSVVKSVVQALAGDGRVLGEAPVVFSGAETNAKVTLTLPVGLRNEVQSLVLKDQNHAGAKQLLDDRWRRKTVAIETGNGTAIDQPLLSSLHYVTHAIEPFAEISIPKDSAELKATLDQGLSMLVLADIGKLPVEDHDAVAAWLKKGGLLLRFAGSKLAANADDLLPVNLRQGERNFDSTLSWETPQTILPFAENSAFAGIALDPQITVSRQILAEPDNALSAKTWASIADGTPLVTSAAYGKGRIVLFHISANADWSNLPLSGTFVEMLQRVANLAPPAGSINSDTSTALVAGDFAQRLVMMGTGELASVTEVPKSLSPKDLEAAVASSAIPAGIYSRGEQNRAVNLKLAATDLAPLPAGLDIQELRPASVVSYAKPLFLLAAALFLADCIAVLFLNGLLAGRKIIAGAVLLFILQSFPAQKAEAETSLENAMQASLQTHLAFVKTGDPETDQTSEEGLKGLSDVVADRTSAVLAQPIAIDIENDDLAFYPMIYWPVVPDADAPNAKALERISSYMKNGGTIFFDLRDQIEFGSNSANEAALQRILAKIDIPPLQKVPATHALTKSFYLLKEFPGRYVGGPLWVEAQEEAATSSADNVSGIIIGSNDYAAAWGLDSQGQPTHALIPGTGRQREFAFRVGINLVMYALTGNYKSDQVHIGPILERLGKK
jgi:Domain of unknown function (DUF4159)/Aerotolerance regulator N-terminal